MNGLIVLCIIIIFLLIVITGYACCVMSGIMNEKEEREMRKLNFELWVKSCEEFRTGIYKLTNNPEDGHGVYQTIREYYHKGEYITTRDVSYHLWWNGEHEAVSTGSATELLRVFEERQKKYNDGNNKEN